MGTAKWNSTNSANCSFGYKDMVGYSDIAICHTIYLSKTERDEGN